MWFDHLGGVTHVHEQLYRSPLPEILPHWRLIRERGVEVVYSLEASAPGHLAKTAGLEWRPHFWTDDRPPTLPQIDALLADLRRDEGRRVLLHCMAGMGRTGTGIACALVERGFSATEALSLFWSRVPRAEGIMRRNGQAEFVHAFDARRRGRSFF